MIFYFSGVGNSAWVAQVLAEQLGERLVKMADYADEQLDIQPDEKVGLAIVRWRWDRFDAYSYIPLYVLC